MSVKQKKGKKKKQTKRSFSGMGYREVQRSNKTRRSRLSKDEQKWLKSEGFKNAGWDDVIALYQKINELERCAIAGEDSLEDLFLKADRIGKKYQSDEEIDDFNRQLAAEVTDIANLIDRQFPEPGMEFIDYSQRTTAKKKKRSRA